MGAGTPDGSEVRLVAGADVAEIVIGLPGFLDGVDDGADKLVSGLGGDVLACAIAAGDPQLDLSGACVVEQQRDASIDARVAKPWPRQRGAMP